MDRWAGPDPEFDDRDGPAGYARRPAVKWVGLLIAWVIVTGLLLAVHLTILIWVIMAGLIAYVVYGIVRDTPHARRPRRQMTSELADAPEDDYDVQERFNPPPGWPEPPPGWTPPPGWRPNPAWPPAPPGWQFWLPENSWEYGGRAARPRSYRHDGDGHRSTRPRL